MFGWDWAPSLPDMGIWRSIYIEGYKMQRMDDVYITQMHEKGNVTLDIRIKLDMNDGIDYDINFLSVHLMGIKLKKV
jgi:beta-mannosidase